MKIHQNRGFTLVEIIVVVGIIALLSGVVIFNVLQSRSLARDRQVIADVQTLKLSFARYAAGNVGGSYPGSANTWHCLKMTYGQCWNNTYYTSSGLNNAIRPYLSNSQYPTPPGTKSGEYRHDSYVYAPSMSGLISGYTGPFLIWWQEKPITNCNGHYYGELPSGSKIYYCAEKLANQ